MIALQSLGATQTAMAAAQKQISTGYRVSDATDDGAAYAVAQSVRTSVSALTSANQQLGNVQGLLSVTNTSLNDVSNTLSQLNSVLVKLADGNTQSTQRSQYMSQYNSLVTQISAYFSEATYNQKSLVAGTTAGGIQFGRTAVVQDDQGSTYAIATFSGSSLVSNLNPAASFTSTSAQSFLQNTMAQQISSVENELNYYGMATNYVNNQISYNSDKIDALNTGLGALIDSNLAQESAQLQALQIQQQLGTQALSMANQAPSTLLSLFK
jgi:flagellin